MTNQDDRYDALLDTLKERIEKYGCTFIVVQPGENDAEFTPYVYVIGSETGYVVTGLEPNQAAGIIQTVLTKQTEIELDTRVKGVLHKDFEVCLKEVPETLLEEGNFGIGTNHFGLKKVVQIYWPDEENRFPWEEGYSQFSQELI